MEIEIFYKPKKDNIEKLRIFGNSFVENNINKCKILYNSIEYDLKEYFGDIKKSYNNKDNFSIKLKGINNITDLSNMFEGCSLLALHGLSKMNTSNIINMSSMFKNCNLSEFSDISKWDTSNVSDMSSMFNGCVFSTFPDISNWNTSNVANMSCIFRGCNSLRSLPDLSKWNISNVNDMSYMFSNCNLLSSPA